MRRTLMVFISSTSDLAAERQALAARLKPSFLPYLYEEDHPASKSPKDRCQEMIEQSDAFVCLLGVRYGSVYSFDVGPRSIVEWEFDTARARGDLALMMFQKEPLANAEPNQQAFIARVSGFGTGIWLKRFKSTDQLVRDVYDSLVQWLVEFRTKVQAIRSRDRSRLQSVLLGLTCLSLGVLLAAAFGFLMAPGSSWDVFTRTSLLVATGAVACLILLGLAFQFGGRRDDAT
jgi:hypothetical protein